MNDYPDRWIRYPFPTKDGWRVPLALPEKSVDPYTGSISGNEYTPAFKSFQSVKGSYNSQALMPLRALSLNSGSVIGYIQDLSKKKNSYIALQFYPSNIDHVSTADIADIKIYSRGVPKREVTGGDVILSMDLGFFGQESYKTAKWLESLRISNVSISKDGKRIVKATKVRFVLGNSLYRKETWLVKSVTINPKVFSTKVADEPTLGPTNRPRVVDVFPLQTSVKLTLVLDVGVDYTRETPLR